MKVLITGGAGFVGSNYAWHLLTNGHDVVIYDKILRAGGLYNVKWLRSHGNSHNLHIIKGDVRDYKSLSRAAEGCDLILHCAAQVSVPLSIDNPKKDFEYNVIGTFNILEVIRRSKLNPILIYTSSNKVYGIPEIKLKEFKTRYDFEEYIDGVNEHVPLKSEEPYGASKAVSDLYLRAYSLRYGLRALSFRCSCMYGPHQWGREEQGWVTWFCIASVLNNPITIFGNGKQVRDLLYIDDAVRAFDLAAKSIDKISGEVINLGGGKENSVSLLEVIDFLKGLAGNVRIHFAEWRPGDTKCYYTDYGKAKKLLGWQPNVSWKEGITQTYKWVIDNICIISALYQNV